MQKITLLGCTLALFIGPALIWLGRRRLTR